MNVKNIINEVINEYYQTDRKRELENFLINSIDFSEDFNYKVPDNVKLKKLFDLFQLEFDHEIKRMGVEKALLYYLQGLPSYLNIPHNYHQIEDLMYSLGYDEVKDMDKKDSSDLYYNEIIDIILDNQKSLEYS